MTTFEYEGLTFKPYKTLKGKASKFGDIARRQVDTGLTPKNWSWEKFYEAAKAADPENGQIDLFICNGQVVIPCEYYLFAYRE